MASKLSSRPYSTAAAAVMKVAVLFGLLATASAGATWNSFTETEQILVYVGVGVTGTICLLAIVLALMLMTCWNYNPTIQQRHHHAPKKTEQFKFGELNFSGNGPNSTGVYKGGKDYSGQSLNHELSPGKVSFGQKAAQAYSQPAVAYKNSEAALEKGYSV